jgi:hypothetical protein
VHGLRLGLGRLGLRRGAYRPRTPVEIDTELRFALRDGSGGNGTLSKRNSGVYLAGKRRLRADAVAIQEVSTFVGETSGETHTGHLIYFPPNATKLYIFESGTTSTPTLASAGVNATMKAAMVAGDIPWGAIIYLEKRDLGGDSLESWGVNAYDGSFDYEDMSVFDVPTQVESLTGIDCSPENICCFGFSEGGFITARKRAKFGASHAAVYVVLDAPRLDADLGGAANAYNSFTAGEKTKLWADSSANLQHECPFASIALTGIFNRLGADANGLGAAPLLMIKSSPGGGSPATNASSMNNAATKLGLLGVDFSEVNLDDAGATPSHVLSQFMTAWAAQTTADANGDVMDISWIVSAANRAGYDWTP